MPNIITHTLFADDVLQALDVPALYAHKHLFEIGANGPDYLFFHRMRPRSIVQGSRLRPIGSWLHDAGTNAFYASALQSIRKESDPAIREDMLAYVCGHLCHWALDSTVHPYVFYRTGSNTRASMDRHHRLESIMDAILLKLKRSQTLKDVDLAGQVSKASAPEARAIARIYVPAIEKLYSETIPAHQIAEALDDWNFAQKILYDPSGRKAGFFRRLEKPIHVDNFFSGLAVPNTPEDNYDILNLLHTLWKNPQSGEESRDSVCDMLDAALIKACQAIRLFLEAAADPTKEAAFLDFLNDANYSCGTKGELLYFDITDFSL